MGTTQSTIPSSSGNKPQQQHPQEQKQPPPPQEANKKEHIIANNKKENLTKNNNKNSSRGGGKPPAPVALRTSRHDSSVSSVEGGDSSVRPRSLHEGLVRQRDKKSELTDYYDVVDEIGRGGLCKVYKIRKRLDKIGGSSRADNVKKKKSFWNGFTSSSTRGSSSRSLRKHSSGGALPSSSTNNSLSSRIMSAEEQRETADTTTTTTIREVATGDGDDETSDTASTLANLSCRQYPYSSPNLLGAADPDSCRAMPALYDMCFALKEINLTMVPKDKIDQLKNEVEILKALDHKNIINAYETFQRDNKILIVMELCTGGDLHSRIPYTEYQVRRMTRQILSAVSYMHDKSIIHRDIKLENIMFENEHPDSIIKVIDFGLSKEYSHKDHILSERVGTLYSMSPETMLGDYTSQADLWSIGVCVYMLLAAGNQPFLGKTPKQMVAKVLLGKYNFDHPAWDGISEVAIDFIRNLLVVEPEDRLTAKTAKQHPWMEKITSGKLDDRDNAANEEFKQRVRECIVRYATCSEFLKLALNVIAKKSTSEEIYELRKVFDEFDTENRGVLNMEEFKAALGQVNKYTEEEMEEMFWKIDVNKNNEINYTEFLAACLETKGQIEEYRLAEAFDLMDSDDSGYISRKNLKQILGEEVDEAYVDQLMSDADFYHDNKISYSEFLQAFGRQKQEEMVYTIYESRNSRHGKINREESGGSSDANAEDVLRKYGILKGLRRKFSSRDFSNSSSRHNKA